MGTDDDGEQFEVNMTKCGCYSHRCCEYQNTCVACRCETPIEGTLAYSTVGHDLAMYSDDV